MPAQEEESGTAFQPVDLGPLPDRLGFLVRLAQVRIYDRFFAAFAGEDLRPGEFSALSVLYRNPGIRQGILAESLSIKRAHMTKMIRAFEDAGLVRRTVPDADRRAIQLDLTPAGRERVERLSARFFGLDETSGSPLSDDEMDELRRLLRKFLRLGA